MRGLMQDQALTVDKILDHAKNWHGHVEVVSRSVEGPIVRTTYANIHARAKRVSNLLVQLGVTLGDRVGTLAWNTARHMEAWYGIMGIGAVCHTLNPRLHPEQIAWIINHAEDKVIFTDLTFLPILEAILSQCPSVEHVVIMTDQSHMPGFKIQGVPAMRFGGAHCYETAIAGQSEICAWGGFDENTACGLCYTSGTTGDPKGVLYSHRSNVIHALVGLQKDVLGLSGIDTVLPVVPMFHANAWGTAFACPAVGAKMVMPGPKMDGASIYELLNSEEVTFSAAVPTVWQMLLSHLDAEHLSLPHLTKVVIGGSACPEAIIRGFKERYEVDVLHAWGMTETSPLGTLGSPNARVAKLSYDEQLQYKLKQGRPPFGIEMKLTDDEGKQLPHDGHTFGHLMVKGPFVVGAYFKGAGGSILDADSFFDTGDVATIDPEGFMQITDRAKDVIKSGGEWISTIDIENIAMGHPKAANAAVIGILHPKWDERPLLLVQLKPGMQATKEEFIQFLEGKIAKWWMPDDVMFVDEIPLGATGKIDKKLLRTRLADYRLPEVPIFAAMAAAAAATPALALRAEPDPVLHAPEPAPETPVPFDAAATDGPVADELAAQPHTPAQAAAVPETPEDIDSRIDALLQPAGESAPAEPTPDVHAPPAPASPVIAAVLGGAAALAGGAFLASRHGDSSTEEPAEAAPGHAAPAPEPAPLDGNLPLAWSPGGDEPAKGEHGGFLFWKNKHGDDDDVPSALPSMPGMTPLGLAGAAGAGALASAAVLKTGTDDKPSPAEPAASAGGLTFPSSLKTSATAALGLASDEAPLAFTPIPPGGRKKQKPKGGLADHYLSLAVLAALAPAAIVAVGAIGMRTGLIGWEEGFRQVLMDGPTPGLGWGPAAVLVSVLTGFVGLLVAAFGGWSRYWRKALLAVAITLATIGGFVGLSVYNGQSPRIHDVATDWSEPLLFSQVVMTARGPDANIVEPDPVVPLDAGQGAGRPLSEINSETCGEARPAMLALQPPQAYAAAKAAALTEGLAIVTDDPAGGRLEATATSTIYGFKDDVVVRVKAQGAGSRVDIRSISRVGDGDMGANCQRIGRMTRAMATGV